MCVFVFVCERGYVCVCSHSAERVDQLGSAEVRESVCMVFMHVCVTVSVYVCECCVCVREGVCMPSLS